jgi:hypothetical protein
MEHDVIYAEDLTLDAGKAFENGVLRFVTYQVSNGTNVTGFQVDFQEESETCTNEAFEVLTSLQSIPVSQATPQP